MAMNRFTLDLIQPLTEWRMLYTRANESIRIRFSRSYLGQFWITISLAFLIGATGVVWSIIWKIPIDTFLPYAGCGHILYLLFSTTITESCQCLIKDKNFYFSRRRSFFVSIYTLLSRNIFVFLYNLPVLAMLILWSDSAELSINFVYLLYIFIVLVYLFFASFLIAVICAYFRDLIQLITTVMSVMFLLTPVLWKTSLVPESLVFFVFLNPFASMLELLRNPLIGEPVHQEAIYIMLGSIAVFFPLSWIVWKTLCRRVIFWL